MPGPQASSSAPSRWIVGPGWDASVALSTLWLPLALLPALPWLDGKGASGVPHSFVVFTCLLTVPHYLTTLSYTYADRGVRGELRAQPLLYFAVPALLFLGSWAYCAGVGPLLPLTLWIAFGEQHVAAQHLGFASLYRERNREGEIDRRIDHWLFGLAWLPTLALYLTHPLLAREGGTFAQPIYSLALADRPQLLLALAAVAAVPFTMFLLRQLERRRKGLPVSLPRLVFVTSAWTSFVLPPFLLDDVYTVSLLRNGTHYVQYLGIVYWLNLQRSALSTPPSGGGLAGRLVRAGPVAYFGVHAALGCLVWYLSDAQQWPGWPNALSLRFAIFPGIAFVHFFLDGLTWNSRRSVARRSVLPFLYHAPAAVRAGAVDAA